MGGEYLTYNPVTMSIETYREVISNDDNSSGIRSAAPAKAHQLILNTYKTPLTRGQKGCYVYCEDPELRKYIKHFLAKQHSNVVSAPIAPVSSQPPLLADGHYFQKGQPNEPQRPWEK